MITPNDATPWQCFIFEIESIFGAPITSRPVMHQMYKIDFSFLGVRCQRGAETDHLPYRPSLDKAYPTYKKYDKEVKRLERKRRRITDSDDEENETNQTGLVGKQ